MRRVRVIGRSRSHGKQGAGGLLELARVVVAQLHERRVEQAGDQALADLDDERALGIGEVGAPEQPLELLGTTGRCGR